jgi:hypothetical protein
MTSGFGTLVMTALQTIVNQRWRKLRKNKFPYERDKASYHTKMNRSICRQGNDTTIVDKYSISEIGTCVNRLLPTSPTALEPLC